MSGLNIVETSTNIGVFINSWVAYINASKAYTNDPDSTSAQQGLIGSAESLSSAIMALKGDYPGLATALGTLGEVTNLPGDVQAYQFARAANLPNDEITALASVAGDASSIAGGAATLFRLCWVPFRLTKNRPGRDSEVIPRRTIENIHAIQFHTK